MPTREDYQRLAEERFLDAKSLLVAKRWTAAYYLAGYAIECGLKSCILRRLAREPHLIFEKRQRKFSEDCWTHDLEKLIDQAGLKSEFKDQFVSHPKRSANWLLVKDWKEDARYAHREADEAKKLVRAISNPRYGALPWIKLRW